MNGSFCLPVSCSFEISDESDNSELVPTAGRQTPKGYDTKNGKKSKSKKSKKHKKKKKSKKLKICHGSDQDDESGVPTTLNEKFTSIMEHSNGQPSQLPEKFKTKAKVESIPTDPNKLVKLITATLDPNAGPSMEIVSSESDSDA